MNAEEFAASANVSRETLDRLEAMDAALLDWSERHNLVARASLPERWFRHYLDSAQLYRLAPEGATRFCDLGSGAGFPGLVLAAMIAPRGGSMTLVESRGKKADFLRAAAQAMGLDNVSVVAGRIENWRPEAPPQVVTARALAPLSKLFALAAPLGDEKTRYLFPKGLKGEAEYAEAEKLWSMRAARHVSVTSADAVIFEIEALQRV